MRPAPFYLYIIVLAACSSPEAPPSVDLIVSVTDESNAPVEGAMIEIDGNVEGATSAQGVHKSSIAGPEGRIVSIRSHCPDGFRPLKGEAKQITCRFLREMRSGALGYLPLLVHLECGLAEQSWVLLIKTNGVAGLPVKALGETVAITDTDGVAHAVLTGAPREEIDIVLDTTNEPDLRPQAPSRRVRVPVKRQILIFDQTFKRESPRKIRKRRRRPHRAGPRRIQ